MTYKEMKNLKQDDQLMVLDFSGGWKLGSFQGHVKGSDPAMWFAFNEKQQEGRGPICTKIYTGLQFTEEYWNDPSRAKVFRWPTEEELNAELLEKMEMA